MTSTDYIKKTLHLIAEKAGVESSEVEESLYFEDDLNIGQLELVEILAELEELFHVELMDNKNDIETVQDLLDLISEQVE